MAGLAPGHWDQTEKGCPVKRQTMCRSPSIRPGLVCIEGFPDPPPESLERPLDEFETEAFNFAARFIPDHNLRLQYEAKVKEMAESILDEFRRGEISADEGAKLANQLRNEILETARGASSDVGRAWAQKLKAEGKTLVDLQEKYAQEIFQREFEALTDAERNDVFLAIIEASGRVRPSVLVTSVRLSKFSKGLLFVTVAVAVYQVATSTRPGREAVKQGAVMATGMGVGALFGAAAATSLVCGPGAPVCVGIFVFVGGGLAAYGADVEFDHFWK